MTKIPVLPNIITAFGLTCGLFVIFKINMTPLSGADLQLLTITAGILLLSALADLMDGAVARALKAESPFGGLFDSLADAITFGVCPSLIVLKSLSLESGTEFSFLLTTAAMVYTMSGVLRLVRFNVMSQEAKSDPMLEESGKKNFTGLPIPAAAAAIVSLNLFLVSDELKSLISLSEKARGWILFIALCSIGYCMVSRWKFPSAKSLHIKVSSFRMVFLTVVLAVIIFYGVLNHFPVTFLVISWGYILVAMTLSLIRIIAFRRSKSLEEFEPEADDLEEK